MNRDDLEFDIHYSFFIEKMNYTLLNRIDKGITLVLIVLGFSVFAPYNNMFLFGVAVAILSVSSTGVSIRSGSRAFEGTNAAVQTYACRVFDPE
ncbi:hypothetical protein [Enterobacter cloacae complex sp. 279F5]|uniref:hypothetical protein n=1 Tax=Enterobacter cloacae complex sp. 279F5 TaxID=3395874 RepID=UPI003CF37F3C